jgi:signal transduction histidine kinase
MKQKTRLLILAFAVSFTIVTALASQAMRKFNVLVAGFDALNKSQVSLEKLVELEGSVKDADRYEMGYMLTRDSNYYLPLIQATTDKLLPATLALRHFTADNSRQQELLTWIRTAIAERLYYLQENLRASASDSANSPLRPAFLVGRQRSQEAIKRLHELERIASSVRNRRAADRHLYQNSTSSSVFILLIVFGTITLLLFIITVRELQHRLTAQEDAERNLRELRQSHNELEQIAHAASHDLQEPLRKIQILTDRLDRMPPSTNEQMTDILTRVGSSASRLQRLVADLVHFTELNSGQEAVVDTYPLEEAVGGALDDLASIIKQKGAEIYCEPLPEVSGYPRQLQILFHSLIDNSLKFAHPDRIPEITIQFQTVEGSELAEKFPSAATQTFHRITIKDNGIGFDNQYSDKIFRLFQRLHTTGYDGQGLGLALCQRIMTNHHGFITAHGHQQTGSTFKLFFPAFVTEKKKQA